MRVRSWLSAAALGLALTIAAAASAEAQIWAYTDAQGRMFFTDTPRHDGYTKVKLDPQRAHGPRTKGVKPTRAWDGEIRRAGHQHGLHPALVKAVIHAESGFDPQAVSSAGAIGLMQLMPATAKEVGVDNAFDPGQNIEGGTKYLSYLVRRYPDDLSLALAAYNAGPTNVQRYNGVPPFEETRTYVRRVKRLYRRYHADFR